MTRRIDEFPFLPFSPNRTFNREASRDVVFNSDKGETYLPKKGKVYQYKNTVIVFGSDATVVYRTN
jgi:hypothetical protein